MIQGKIADIKYDSSCIEDISSKLSAVLNYEPEENEDSAFLFHQTSNLTLCSQGDVSEMISIENESRQAYLKEVNKNDLRNLKLGMESSNQKILIIEPQAAKHELIVPAPRAKASNNNTDQSTVSLASHDISRQRKPIFNEGSYSIQGTGKSILDLKNRMFPTEIELIMAPDPRKEAMEAPCPPNERNRYYKKEYKHDIMITGENKIKSILIDSKKEDNFMDSDKKKLLRFEMEINESRNLVASNSGFSSRYMPQNHFESNHHQLLNNQNNTQSSTFNISDVTENFGGKSDHRKIWASGRANPVESKFLSRIEASEELTSSLNSCLEVPKNSERSNNELSLINRDVGSSINNSENLCDTSEGRGITAASNINNYQRSTDDSNKIAKIPNVSKKQIVQSLNESLDTLVANETSRQEENSRRMSFLTDVSETDISGLQKKLKKQPMHKNTLKFLESHLPGLNMIEEKADALEASKKIDGTQNAFSNMKSAKKENSAKREMIDIKIEDSFHFSETRELNESLHSLKKEAASRLPTSQMTNAMAKLLSAFEEVSIRQTEASLARDLKPLEEKKAPENLENGYSPRCAPIQKNGKTFIHDPKYDQYYECYPSKETEASLGQSRQITEDRETQEYVSSPGGQKKELCIEEGSCLMSEQKFCSYNVEEILGNSSHRSIRESEISRRNLSRVSVLRDTKGTNDSTEVKFLHMKINTLEEQLKKLEVQINTINKERTSEKKVVGKALPTKKRIAKHKSAEKFKKKSEVLNSFGKLDLRAFLSPQKDDLFSPQGSIFSSFNHQTNSICASFQSNIKAQSNTLSQNNSRKELNMKQEMGTINQELSIERDDLRKRLFDQEHNSEPHNYSTLTVQSNSKGRDIMAFNLCSAKQEKEKLEAASTPAIMRMLPSTISSDVSVRYQVQQGGQIPAGAQNNQIAKNQQFYQSQEGAPNQHQKIRNQQGALIPREPNRQDERALTEPSEIFLQSNSTIQKATPLPQESVKSVHQTAPNNQSTNPNNQFPQKQHAPQTFQKKFNKVESKGSDFTKLDEPSKLAESSKKVHDFQSNDQRRRENKLMVLNPLPDLNNVQFFGPPKEAAPLSERVCFTESFVSSDDRVTPRENIANKENRVPTLITQEKTKRQNPNLQIITSSNQEGTLKDLSISSSSSTKSNKSQTNQQGVSLKKKKPLSGNKTGGSGVYLKVLEEESRAKSKNKQTNNLFQNAYPPFPKTTPNTLTVPAQSNNNFKKKNIYDPMPSSRNPSLAHDTSMKSKGIMSDENSSYFPFNDKSTCSFSLLRLSAQQNDKNSNYSMDKHQEAPFQAMNQHQKLVLQKSLLKNTNDQKFSKKLLEKELSMTLINSPSRDDIAIEDSGHSRPVEAISDTSSYHLSYSEDKHHGEEDINYKIQQMHGMVSLHASRQFSISHSKK